MTITAEQKETLARELARRIFVDLNATAHSDLTELKAAVQKIDDAMEFTTTQAAAAYPATKIKLALLAHVKTGAGNLTNQQAGVALALWALNEAGLL